jgi:hypothetical protein
MRSALEVSSIALPCCADPFLAGPPLQHVNSSVRDMCGEKCTADGGATALPSRRDVRDLGENKWGVGRLIYLLFTIFNYQTVFRKCLRMHCSLW